jgi:hypothetical protein
MLESSKENNKFAEETALVTGNCCQIMVITAH